MLLRALFHTVNVDVRVNFTVVPPVWLICVTDCVKTYSLSSTPLAGLIRNIILMHNCAAILVISNRCCISIGYANQSACHFGIDISSASS